MDNTDIEILDPFITEHEILQYEQPNPFFLPIEGSALKYTKTKFLADTYKYVYILCLDDDFEQTQENINKINLFMAPDSEISELHGQSKLVTLVQGPFCLIREQSIRKGLLTIEGKILEKFNHNHSKLGSKELVYLMLQSKESYIRSWLKIYQSDGNLDKFIEQKIFSSYYNLEDKKIDENLLGLISQVADFKYWQDERNCSLAINKAFSERKFNLAFIQKWNLPTDEIEKELQNLLQNFANNKTICKNPAYPEEITNPKNNESQEDPYKTKQYVDGSKSDYRHFYEITKTEELMMKPENIEELLLGHSLNQKEKYFLICNLLISKNYCHYVLNNYKVLNANKELFEKYKPIFRYLIGYSWISLYMEESIRKTRTKESDRFVFDIDTAASLPVFPFAPNQPHLNPYFCCIVSDKLLNSSHNINGVKQTIDYQNGIVDSNEFKKRLNIFITGDANKDLLAGANWSNMVITGGLMAGIIPETNPLMALHKTITDPKIPPTDQELNRFYQEYYAKSDIDIACNHYNIIDFIEHVKHIRSVILKNLGDNIKEAEVQIKPNKSLAIYINAKMLKAKCDRGEIPFKYDYIMGNKNQNAVKFYFYKMYVDKKRDANINNEKILGNKTLENEYFEVINYCKLKKTVLIINDYSFETDIIDNRTPEANSGIEMVYLIHEGTSKIIEEDFEMDDSKDQNRSNLFIKFSETLKYKIISKHMKHPFELFRITEKEFFSCIARFHMPCVRSYYNGKTCFLLTSAIISYLTLTCIDFKYFVGSNDPISIINKYRQRGYSTILNKTEINQFLSYILTFPNCKKMYGITDTKDIKNIVGSLDINHEFFKPRKNIPEEYYADPDIKLDYKNIKIEYINDQHDLIKYYKKKYPKYSQEFLSQRTIGNNGQIEPVKRWMIDAAYDLL